MNPLTFLFDFFNQIINLAITLYGFLFYEFNIAGINITMWSLLGGVGVVVLLVYSLLK